ncbi:hypothetical protein Q8A67_022661 [Cirrhinus molitorella]|uniref:Uncharacterized protein n=1 Tax=Cirrhinus molitorella TaxID=172907 RepID=A0AA88TFH0_9TELE|nr:hypothetical protein Q8A67_022661 [Cirrhinus molitorella]
MSSATEKPSASLSHLFSSPLPSSSRLLLHPASPSALYLWSGLALGLSVFSSIEVGEFPVSASNLQDSA